VRAKIGRHRGGHPADTALLVGNIMAAWTLQFGNGQAENSAPNFAEFAQDVNLTCFAGHSQIYEGKASTYVITSTYAVYRTDGTGPETNSLTNQITTGWSTYGNKVSVAVTRSPSESPDTISGTVLVGPPISG
jgi:hypothetical protein